MKRYKIEHFLKDFRDISIGFRELDSRECKDIKEKLAAAFGYSKDVRGSVLLKNLASISCNIEGENAEKEGFNFSDLLRRFEICANEVYLNWRQFDVMDEFVLEDFSKYFSYVWYPAADEIEIFDKSFGWVVFLSHYGSINLAVRPGARFHG